MADRPRTAFGLVVVLATLAISGCGGAKGTGTSATGSGASATPAQFIAQASSICRGVVIQEEPLKTREESLKSLPAETAEKELVSLANQASAISRTADGRLRALPRPPADAKTIGQLVQAYAEEATDASAIANAAAHEESQLGESAARALADSIAAHSASAKKLGMGDCFAGE
jgi:hypothetical protein